MDQILTLPENRKPQKPVLLCALMAVVALLLISAYGTPRDGAPRTLTAATSPMLVASN